MTTSQDLPRIDSVSRTILATPRSLYRAHLDPEMLASWRAPEGMRAQVLSFDGRLGGGYEMALHYRDNADAGLGKSAPGIDRFKGEFVELVLDERIVERIQFASEDPAYARPMTMETTLRAVRDGTKVIVACTDVPDAISAEDHVSGIASALRNLAMLTE